MVLGGGGSTGNAWLIGVVAGLDDAGVDVTTADLTIGTSAGATAAAQLAGARPSALLADALVETPPRPGGGARPATEHLARIRAIIDEANGPADLRRRLGAAALRLDPGSDEAWQPQWRATVASRLPNQDWPTQTVLMTALDARTGGGVVLGRDSGVDLADAVAASCSSGRPYWIADRPFIDGGFRRNENADLAAGHGRVLVLSPLGGLTLHPTTWGTGLSTQVDELRSGGSSVEVIVPDPGDEHLFGANAMDLSLRPDAARAGYASGLGHAERLAAFWG